MTCGRCGAEDGESMGDRDEDREGAPGTGAEVKLPTPDEVQGAVDEWLDASREYNSHDAETSVRNCAEMLCLFFNGMPMSTILAAEKSAAKVREEERRATEREQQSERTRLRNNQRQRLGMTHEEYDAFRRGDIDSKKRPMKVQIRLCPRCDLELPENGPCPMGLGDDCMLSAGQDAGFRWLKLLPDSESPIM